MLRLTNQVVCDFLAASFFDLPLNPFGHLLALVDLIREAQSFADFLYRHEAGIVDPISEDPPEGGVIMSTRFRLGTIDSHETSQMRFLLRMSALKSNRE